MFKIKRLNTLAAYEIELITGGCQCRCWEYQEYYWISKGEATCKEECARWCLEDGYQSNCT